MDTRPLRVLVVEDEALIALDTALSLEEMGHEVVAVTATAEEALAAAAGGVDLALVDLNLRDGATGPGIGRALAARHGATVLYLTANPRQAGRAEEALGVLPKPFTEEALAGAVRFAAAARAGRPAEPPEALRLTPRPATA